MTPLPTPFKCDRCGVWHKTAEALDRCEFRGVRESPADLRTFSDFVDFLEEVSRENDER